MKTKFFKKRMMDIENNFKIIENVLIITFQEERYIFDIKEKIHWEDFIEMVQDSKGNYWQIILREFGCFFKVFINSACRYEDGNYGVYSGKPFAIIPRNEDNKPKKQFTAEELLNILIRWQDVGDWTENEMLEEMHRIIADAPSSIRTKYPQTEHIQKFKYQND